MPVMNLSSPRTATIARWYHWIILAGLIAIGAGLRFHQITKVGLWPDEFWSSVHLATGRGTAIFDLPAGVLMQPPPQTLLEGAPPWWHIWTGLRGIVHPPLYLILLRWWMDLFGSSDLSTRTFSAMASLAATVVLSRHSPANRFRQQAGLIAAVPLMVVSPLQINLSQESRPYPLLMLSALIAAHALLRIERQGASTGRLVQFGMAMAATALIHYFSLGALLAILIYAAIRRCAESTGGRRSGRSWYGGDSGAGHLGPLFMATAWRIFLASNPGRSKFTAASGHAMDSIWRQYRRRFCTAGRATSSAGSLRA